MLVLTGGDPLMRRDVLTLARTASDLGLRVSLSPSGTARLDKTEFSRFVDAGIQSISLSLDGASQATHDRFRGVSGTFHRTIKAVAKAHQVGLDVQINTTLTAGNIHEFSAFHALMNVLKPAMWSVFLVVPTGRAAARDLPDPTDLERVFEKLADLVGTVPYGIKTTEGHHFRRVMIQRGKGGTRRKMGLRAPLGIRDGRGVMFISHTGDVSPSGFLPIDCGNVRDRASGRDLPRAPALRLSS